MPLEMPRSYAGDAHFAALLRDVKCPMPLHQVKAFVLGCLAATDMPKVNEILATMWGGEVPAFDGMEELKNFTGQFFALWNELARRVERPGFPLTAARDVERLSDVAHHSALRQEEVSGFLRGLEVGHTDPEGITAEAERALTALVTASHFWSEFDRLIREQPTESAQSLGETVANLRQLDQVAGDAIGILMAEQRRARLQQMRPGTAGRTQVKAAEPGRNDPCPCGSGKKYKQCCGKH